jgi:ketosteroid isomerase-like protein
MSTATGSNLAVVKGFYDLVGQGKLEEAEAFLHEDLVIKVPPGMPYSGEYRGPQGFRDDMAAIMELYDPKPLNVEYFDNEDPVVIKIDGGFTSKATGEHHHQDIVELFYVRDGKIVELDIYYKDPAAVNRLAGR